MILSNLDSVPLTYANRQVNGYGAPGLQHAGFPGNPVGRVPSRDAGSAATDNFGMHRTRACRGWKQPQIGEIP